MGINVHSFAFVYGVILLVAGVIAFFPGLLTPHEALEHELLIKQSAGEFLGHFPTNALHNLGHATAGVAGLLVFRNECAALIYARVLALGLALVAILGLIPATNTLFGLVPLHDYDVAFHAVLAIGAAYVGFIQRRDSERSGRSAARDP